MSRPRRRSQIALALILGMVGVVGPVSAAQTALGAAPTPGGDEVGIDVDTSVVGTVRGGSPLSLVATSPDLNCDVRHVEDVQPEFFGETACAAFVAVNGDSGTLQQDVSRGASAYRSPESIETLVGFDGWR